MQVYWSFDTRPPSILPVDLDTATPPELHNIAEFYPDLRIAGEARARLRTRTWEYDPDGIWDDWTRDLDWDD